MRHPLYLRTEDVGGRQKDFTLLVSLTVIQVPAENSFLQSGTPYNSSNIQEKSISLLNFQLIFLLFQTQSLIESENLYHRYGPATNLLFHLMLVLDVGGGSIR